MIGFPKPPRGEFLRSRKAARRELVKHEQREMQAALRLDEHKCRWPRCDIAKRDGLPVDPCHVKHRGMGGNPTGDRTDRTTVISLCRVHHGLYDGAQIDFEPLTDRGTRGPCAWYLIDAAGLRHHVATDKIIGVSEVRGV